MKDDSIMEDILIHTLLILLLASILAFMGFLFVRACAIEQEQNIAVISTTEYWGGTIYTIEQDKHWFVVEGRTDKGAIIHHPNCPCLKEKK